jgi:hypothetical protein
MVSRNNRVIKKRHITRQYKMVRRNAARLRKSINKKKEEEQEGYFQLCIQKEKSRT